MTAGAGRRPLVFGAPQAQMFGWLHEPAGIARGVAVLLCPPLGIEYINSHRSVRHLAEQLAAAGFPALRFDYPGTGDSAHADVADGRLAAWTEGVAQALDALRQHTGCARVAVVGIRFGATLACLAAARGGVDWLVAWNPVIQGRQYAREMRAIAQLAGYEPHVVPGLLEVAGFGFTDETIRDISAVDVQTQSWPGLRGALVIGRDDLGADERLPRRLAELGVPHEAVRMPGYERMVCESIFTEVPRATLDLIADWLGRVSAGVEPTSPRPPRAAGVPALEIEELREEPMSFGPGERLFGVLCRPRCADDPLRPLLVMLNCGADHHVGPGRLHVKMARALAADGFASLRLDIGGLGDSAYAGMARENESYPPSALGDIALVLRELAQRLGRSRFILTGVCAGASHAFAAAQLDLDVELPEVILLNPLRFDMSVDAGRRVNQDLADEAEFERRLKRRKMARGHRLYNAALNVYRRLRIHQRAMRLTVDAWTRALAERFGLRPQGAVALALRDIERRRRHVTLFIAADDPGMELLMSQAGSVARQGLRDGWIEVTSVPEADHIFSTGAARGRLIAEIRAHLRRHVPQPAPPPERGAGAPALDW